MTITVGSLTNVPAPGDPIRSPWAQAASGLLVHAWATAAARDAAWGSAPNGSTAATLDTPALWVRTGGAWVQPRAPIIGPDSTTGTRQPARIRAGYLTPTTDANGNFVQTFSPPIGSIAMAMAVNSDAPNVRFITPYGAQFSPGATTVTWRASVAGGGPLISTSCPMFYLVIDY